MGIQWADVEGFRFSRDDVRGKAMANLYSQILGEEFTRSIKPFEVEIVVAEVGDENLAGHEKNALYKIGFDGTIQDQEGFVVIGGSVDNLQSHMSSHYRAGLSLAGALKLGRDALHRAENGNPDLTARHLEVALLDRARTGRKFRRLTANDIQQLIA
jgi:proteasome alpha subunit